MLCEHRSGYRFLCRIRNYIGNNKQENIISNQGVILYSYSSIFNQLGNISSIIALFLTIWILSKLRCIRRNFLFQARFPDLKRKIARHRSSLSKLLNAYDDSADQVETELKKCQANLLSLKPKVTRSLRGYIKQLVRHIKYISRSYSHPSKEEIRKVYMSLVFIEQELA